MDCLTQAFAIDAASYANMSNHYHLVVRVDSEKAQHWSWQEVVSRWHLIYQGNMLSQRFMRGEALPTAERRILQSKAEDWRTRLSDISWFMSALNEHIARKANIEDDVTGEFWQSRFFSQALLDEQAILACAVYCDLNPIRANIAETPEDSAYTSFRQRIKAAKNGTVPINLLRFQGPEIKDQEPGLPCSLKDYIELVEATGRIERADKRGAVAASQSPILKRLKVDPTTWHQIATTFEDSAGGRVGHPNRVKETCERLEKRWICQSATITKLYPT